MDSCFKRLLFFHLLYKAVRSWQRSVRLNEEHARFGCFEGPYSYSADLHWECDEGKRRVVRLYKLYNSKINSGKRG